MMGRSGFSGRTDEARDGSARARDGSGLTDGLRRRIDAGPVARGDTVMVALSGGLDSVALLHLLRFPLAGLGLALRAAHLDHAMRPGSAADAAWVRGLCRAWDVPVAIERLDPPAAGEADARTRRYAFLERATPEDAWILTAHHRDDQAETVLFRAIRGTGIRGLRGIAPRWGRVLRPLLPFGRGEIRAYADTAGLRFRVDPTNRDLGYARNQLRHAAIPALEQARPGATRALARLAERARAAERGWSAALDRLEAEVVTEEEEGGATLARDVLQSYHRDLRARVLRHVLRRYGRPLDSRGTHAALEFISSGPSGGEIHLAGGLRLERDFERIRIVTDPTPEPEDVELDVPGPDPGAGRARIGGREILVRWGPTGAERVEDEGPGITIEGPGITIPAPSFPLTVRGWRPGDRIRFDYGSKKLTRLFGERRMDRRARRQTPLVVDAHGRVLWVAGVARADGVSEDGVGFRITVTDAG